MPNDNGERHDVSVVGEGGGEAKKWREKKRDETILAQWTRNCGIARGIARRFILTIVNTRNGETRCYTWRSLKLNEISPHRSRARRGDKEGAGRQGDRGGRGGPVCYTAGEFPRIYTPPEYSGSDIRGRDGNCVLT